MRILLELAVGSVIGIGVYTALGAPATNHIEAHNSIIIMASKNLNISNKTTQQASHKSA